MASYSVILKNLDDTRVLAQAMQKSIYAPMVISLNGDLGAGKTTLTREIIYAYGVRGRVKSPTFTLLEEYQVDLVKILHFDLYRFADAEEWVDLGFDELLQQPNSIAFIEWAQNAQDVLPPIDWSIRIEVIDENTRKLEINTQTKTGEECLIRLIKIVEA